MILEEDFYCLGEWEPKEYTKDAWIDHLRIIFKFIDYVDDISIITRTADFRPPSDHITGGLASGATYWHQDLNGEDVWMIIWSNIHPTRLRQNNKEMYLKPKYIYAFKNAKYEHMTPLEAIDTLRYFAKCQLKNLKVP